MAHVTQTTFATRLKETMEERSLKQVDLVQLASERGHKLGKSQLSQYLSGKTEPRPEMLNILSELLGVSTDRLSVTAPETSTPTVPAEGAVFARDAARAKDRRPTQAIRRSGMGKGRVILLTP